MGGFSTAPLLIWKMTYYRAHKTLDFGSSYTNVLFFQDRGSIVEFPGFPCHQHRLCVPPWWCA